MEKLKHTPGPWKSIDVTSENTAVYHRIDAGEIAIGFAGIYKLKDKSQSEANAKLIAAAPDLLEALLNIENDAGTIPESIWKMRNDAIKKAIE